MSDNTDKQIILMPNQVPQFVGTWTVGDIRQMAQGLLMWLDSLKISSESDKNVKSSLSTTDINPAGN